ncbi:YdcH family protein [Sphingobium chungangianum]
MRRLELLRIEHRDLDGAIEALVDAGGRDQMQIARLKKRKLRLRDEIALLEDALVPDIIA